MKTAAARSNETSLSAVAYSIPTLVFPKLQAAYQATPAGKDVKFSNSFAASEVQSKAVAAGLPADVVNFSIDADMDRLVQDALVDKTWANNTYQGFFSKSVVVFVLVPLAALTAKGVQGGWSHFWAVAWNPEAQAALKLTLGLAVAVVAINAVTGTMLARTLVHDNFPGKGVVNVLIDLPLALPTIVAGLTLLAFYGPTGGVGVNVAFTRWGVPMALSPVVVGLSLYLLYGREGWFGRLLFSHNMRVLFAYPGILLATTFVSLPFVVREVVPNHGSEHEAQVERIVPLGFETRVDLVRDDGHRLHVQLTRDEADELELDRGDIVYVRTRRERTFSA